MYFKIKRAYAPRSQNTTPNIRSDQNILFITASLDIKDWLDTRAGLSPGDA
jgi:hypothetical protein